MNKFVPTEPDEKIIALSRSVLLAATGLIMFMVAFMVAMPIELHFFILSLSVPCLIAGLWLTLHNIEAMTKTESNATQRKGIIWVWAVCFLAIVVYSVAWFSMGWVWDLFYSSINTSFTFNAQATLTITFMSQVIVWHPVIFILGMLLWAFINSQRREDVTYPYY